MDRKIVRSVSPIKMPNLRQFKHFKKVLSVKEYFFVKVLFLILAINILMLGLNFFNKHVKAVPAPGGEYTEGMIGSPQYINPLYYSVNDIDRDIGSLIYSSLFNRGEDGTLEEDLIVNYEKKDEGKKYIAEIDHNARWHNGDEITADDVVFTFNAIKDSNYNSPIKGMFNGVKIKATAKKELEFTLEESIPDFAYYLTFGILPSRLWGQVDPGAVKLTQLNLKPIGSGPFKFDSLTKNESGKILSYKLTRNDEYYGNRPFLDNITFKFFINEFEAIDNLNKNKIDGISHIDASNIDDIAAQNSLNIYNLDTSRITSLFLNQKKPFLKERDFRELLTVSMNKNKIIEEVMGDAVSRNLGPIPSFHPAYGECLTPENDCTNKYLFDKKRTEVLLSKLKLRKEWIEREELDALKDKQKRISEQEGSEEEEEEKEKLSKTERQKIILGEGEWLYSTSSEDEIKQYVILDLLVGEDERYIELAQKIKETWEDLGIKVVLNTENLAQIQSQAVNKKDFDVLLYSYNLGNIDDIYYFWHSSQAEKQKLNLSGYENEEVDKAIERLRKETNKEKRNEQLKIIQKNITTDIPAIFLFSFDYIYPQSKKIKNFDVENISKPSDRFANINEWYIKTSKVIDW